MPSWQRVMCMPLSCLRPADSCSRSLSCLCPVLNPVCHTRLWSVSHSNLCAHLVASASDNGSINLWSGPGLATCAATILPGQGAPVCGVAFSSLDEHLLAAASADSNAYVYDIRHSSKPLQVFLHQSLCMCLHSNLSVCSHLLDGHNFRRIAQRCTPEVLHAYLISSNLRHVQLLRHLAAVASRATGSSDNSPLICLSLQVLQGHSHAVSFVRFLGHEVVTASIDGTLGWWDLGNSQNASGDATGKHQDVLGAPAKRLRTLHGHANAQNFVGLSVREHDRLIACGSERGSAYVYHTSWDTPVASAPAISRQGLHSQASSAQHALQQLQLQTSGSGAMSSASGVTSSGAGFQPPVSRLAHGQLEDNTGLVSAVAWRPVVSQWKPRAFLAAASSTGDLGLLSLEVCSQII